MSESTRKTPNLKCALRREIWQNLRKNLKKCLECWRILAKFLLVNISLSQNFWFGAVQKNADLVDQILKNAQKCNSRYRRRRYHRERAVRIWNFGPYRKILFLIGFLVSILAFSCKILLKLTKMMRRPCAGWRLGQSMAEPPLKKWTHWTRQYKYAGQISKMWNLIYDACNS
jgi:hypothetical protein